MVMLSLVFASCGTTQSWMLSLVSASCIVTTHSCPILNFTLLVPISTCNLFPIPTVVRLYDLIVTFSCSHFVHTFAPRKHVISGVVFTLPVGYSRPPSAVNDPPATKRIQENHALKNCSKYLYNRSPCSISTWFISIVTFIGMRSPP